MGFRRDLFSKNKRGPVESPPPYSHESRSHDSREDKPEHDWKRTTLIAGLGALSWVATYVGMLELIEANMGELPFVHKIIIGFSVAMLMIMIVWLLDQLFKPHPFVTKILYAAGYVFLSLISVGFGFGFYWKVLESRGEASRSAESAVGQVQGSLHAASTRLEQLQATLIQLTAVSTSKAEIERTKGTSCPNSKPGDGPRRKMREEDAQRFTFASEFVKGRVTSVKGDMAALDGDLLKIVSSDASTIDIKSGNRNEFMRALGRKLDMTVTGFNAFRTDPQLRQIRTDLADRAEKTTFGDPKGGVISCPDAQLQTALRGVVKAIDQLPELEKPQIAAVEGSEATIEAFRRLTTTFYGALSFKMPPSADELRDLQKKAVQSVEGAATAEARQWAGEQGGLSKRDYVPLAVALFVDLCLFLVSMVQKPAGRLAGLMPKMHAAERGPVIQILSRFKDIHKDQQIRENFEIFRHVVFDMNGDYYVAVPLDAPPKLNPHEREELRVEAQLLANLFASFEKERIFKRTMLPTTASIQKRLKRQGSKFASAEAFRVYKFTDGAWSDIILGAVMGAARRVDEQKRAQGIDVDANGFERKPVPYVGAPAALPPAISRPMHSGPISTQGAPSFDPRPVAARGPAPSMHTSLPPRRAAAAATLSIDPEHAARFGPYASNVPQMAPFNAGAPQSPRVPRPAPPPPPEADVTVKAANSNTVTVHTLPPHPFATAPNEMHQSPRESSVVVALARSTGDTAGRMAQSEAQANPPSNMVPNMVDVTLARETATFSVPVSEAMMPDSLRGALAKARQDAAQHAVAEASNVPANRESTHDDLPDNLNASRVIEIEFDDEPDDEIIEPVEKDDLTARELAFLSRMAPPAAE
jgi:hypothetical protein